MASSAVPVSGHVLDSDTYIHVSGTACLIQLLLTALLMHLKATSQLVTWSSRHTVMSWHGHVVTRSTSHQSTRHTHLVKKSARHKRAHKKAIPVVIFFLHATQVAPINSAEHGVIMASKYTRHTQCRAVRFDYLGLMCVISKSPMTAKLLNAMNSRSKSTVNSSQCRQTQRSTRHTILRCDELTVWQVDWFPI